MANQAGKRRTLVLGIGNLLMGDEGVGVHVARYLQEHALAPEADVVDGGTGGFHLLEYFERYDELVLVDATLDGQAPGTLRLLEPRMASDFPPTLTAHDIGLKDMLEAASLLGHHPRILLLAISIPGADQVDLDLSSEIRAAVPRAARLIAGRLGPAPA